MSIKGVRKKFNKYDLAGDYGICYTEEWNAIYFDKEHYEKMKPYYWCIGVHGKPVRYSREGGNVKQIYLHRFLFGIQDNFYIKYKTDALYDVRKENIIINKVNENPLNKFKTDEDTYHLMESLTRRLKKTRKEIGITQRQLSYFSGVSRTSISHMELSNAIPSMVSFIRICNALDIDIRLFSKRKKLK